MKTIIPFLILGLPLLAAEPIQLGKYGTQRELFVDNHLIDKLTGDAKQHLHRPEPKEVILTTDKPWEGNTCAYYTIFRDGNLFRMYYRGSHWDTKAKKATHSEVTCYAESKDGIHWTRYPWEPDQVSRLFSVLSYLQEVPSGPIVIRSASVGRPVKPSGTVSPLSIV